MNPNVLRQFLDIYDREGMAGPRYASAPHGAISQLGAVPITGGGGGRFQWAQAMAQQEADRPAPAPDFFGGDGGGYRSRAYVRPAQMPGLPPEIANYAMGARNATANPPAVQNYLTNLLTRGGARG